MWDVTKVQRKDLKNCCDLKVLYECMVTIRCQLKHVATYSDILFQVVIH